jgi:hypothetical protein
MIVFTNFSCKQKSKFCEELKLNTDVENVITNYVNKHPQFNTLILQSTKEIEKNEHIMTIQGFLLGPGYESILKKEHPILHFDISGKRIFYLSDINTILKENKNSWIVKNEPDSIVIFNDWIIKDTWELFIHRAIYFYYDDSGILEINYRPDTIFAPKLIEDTDVKVW